MPLNMKRSVLAIEAEATPGTAETLAGVDAFHVFNLQPPTFEFPVPQLQRVGSMDSVNATPGMVTGSIQFEVPLRYAPAADLFPALGLSVSATTLWGPDSDSSNWGTVTAGYYLDGRLHRLAGCMGTATWRYVVGQVPVLNVTLSGVYVPPTDTALLAPTVANFANTGIKTFKGDTLTYNGNAERIREFTMDLNNEVVPIEKADSTYGVERFWIGNRDVQGTIDPLAELLATYDHWTDMIDGDDNPISVVHDTVTELTIPKAGLTGLNMTPRGPVVAEALTWRAMAGSSGDDSFTYDTDNSD